MKRFATVLILSACLVASGSACGGDDGDEGSNAMAGAGAGEGGSTGGSSGEGGSTGGSSGEGGESGTSGGSSGTSGGSSGTSGGSGGSAAEPVVCGGVTCDPPESSRLRACCVEDTDECGQKIGGGFIQTECSLPAEPHPECDGVMGMMGLMLVGCCTDEGRCGITQPLFSFPCTANEELAAIAADAGVDLDGGMGSNPLAIEPPEPKACTP